MATAQASTPPPTPTTQRIPQEILQQPKIKRKVNFSVEETEYQDEPSTKRTRNYLISTLNEVDIQIVPTKLRDNYCVKVDSRVNFLLRSVSEPNILKPKETFRAIRKLEEIDGQFFKSSEEIRREYKDYGHLSSDDRDKLWHKMSKIFVFFEEKQIRAPDNGRHGHYAYIRRCLQHLYIPVQ